MGPVPTSAIMSSHSALHHSMVENKLLLNRNRCSPSLAEALHKEIEVNAQGHCESKNFTMYPLQLRQPPRASSPSTFQSTAVRPAGWNLGTFQYCGYVHS